MANENIVIDLSENYGDVKIAHPEDRLSLLSLLPIFRRHWLPCGLFFLSGLGLSILAAILFPGSSSYEATGKLLFQANNTKSELTGIADNLDPLETTGILANPLSTQANLLTSGFLLKDVIVNLQLTNDEGKLLSSQRIRDKITVQPVTATDILQVSYGSQDPQEAAQVVNELMNLYVQFVEQEQKAEILAAKDFIDEQLPQFRADLNFAAGALERFKAENQVIALDKQAIDLTSLITGLDKQLNDVQIALEAADAKTLELSRKLDINVGEALDLSTLNDNPGIQNVLQELHTVETELAKQSGLYLPQHPTIVNLNNQADQLSQLLLERISTALGPSFQASREDLQLGNVKQNLLSDLIQTESERILLETQLSAVQELQQEYNNQVLRFPSLERQQFALEQSLANAQRSYDELRQRAQELRLAEIQIDGTNYVQIVEEASPPQAVTSKVNLMLLGLGGITSLMLSTLVALVLELSDKTVKTTDDLIQILGHPLLGLIPEFNQIQKNTLSLANPTVAPDWIDHYRSIYSSIKVMNLDQAAQIITVTSSVHGEGKSLTASNLAATIAQAGRRVLLVDADLKTPIQHHLWQISNDIGLSHFLSEKYSLGKVVHQLDSYLSVMPAGITVAEPSLFFESSQMKQMLDEARENYDYIIFDTSPILTAPDALLLGQLSDGIIMVGRPKHVLKSDVLATNQLMEKAKLNVIGSVINCVSNHEKRASRLPFSYTYQHPEQANGYESLTRLISYSRGAENHSEVNQLLSNGASKGTKDN